VTIRRVTTENAAPQGREEGNGGHREHRWEIMIASLLGLAAIATAFAAYQAELKDGDSIKNFNEGIRSVSDANQAYLEGNQQFVQDQGLFLEYAKAANNDDPDLAEYMKTLMSKELVAGIDWWQNTKNDADTPFVDENPKYSIPAYATGEELTKKTDAQFKSAKQLDEDGDRFTLITVILAATLFLYGIAAVSKNHTVRYGTAGMGFGIFLLSVVLLITA
jgi:hypothetical protein